MAYGKEDTSLINFSTFKLKAGDRFTGNEDEHIAQYYGYRLNLSNSSR